MDYKQLGSSGLRVSEMCLGAMTFGRADWGATPEESRRVFEAYGEAGGNFVDTANNYADGRSEEIVGQLLNDDRDRFVRRFVPVTSTRLATTARAWSGHWIRACAVCAPTTSTCCGSMSGTG